MKARRVPRMVSVSAAACSLLIAGSSAQSQSRSRDTLTDYLPPGAAKTLVGNYCSACHALDGTIQLRQTRPEWEAIVFDMVARGAPLTVEEAELAVGYLSDVFGTASPPLTDVNTASKEDLAKLPGVTPAHADRLVAHRTANGPFSAREQVRTVLRVDERTFDRMKWYIRPATDTAR